MVAVPARRAGAVENNQENLRDFARRYTIEPVWMD